MSLLLQNTDEKTKKIARKVFEKQFELDSKLTQEYDERRKEQMYNDILYNLGYLNVAIEFDEDKVFTDYAVWIYHLLCNLMKDLDRNRIKEQMIHHYNLLDEALSTSMSKDNAIKASYHIKNAIKATEEEALNYKIDNRFETGKYKEIKQEYLQNLLDNNTKAAINIIEQSTKSGIELKEIYQDILQEVMYEVGNLWHRNIITVDKEHYCTTTTQMVLSSFYPVIFSSKPNGCKILSCSVGSELHELGIRMLSDLFEYNGWDSIYLGAAVPENALIKSIGENKPDLVALSVTMPQHLALCNDMAKAIRQEFPEVKIAVGGRAFQTTNELWKKWDVDIYTETAGDLVDWANENIVLKK